MIRILAVEPLPGFRLRLTLTTGRTIERDLLGFLANAGPVFAPIREADYFAQVRVAGGTVVWPNGADLDPDVLIWGEKGRVPAIADPVERAHVETTSR